MSTPPEQYVPTDFQNVIALPTGPNEGTVAQLNQQLAQYQAEINTLTAPVKQATEQATRAARASKVAA